MTVTIPWAISGSDACVDAEVGSAAVVVDPSVMDPVFENLAAVSVERLEAAIGAGAARIAALQCKWLLLLAEFVNRHGFDRWGMSAEHWLSWRCGLDRVTAREHLRVAAALTVLPAIQGAFAEGKLSYSKVRAITRVATDHDEQAWVDTAIGLPAAKLARLTGQYRTITSAEEQQQSRDRSLTYRWDLDGMLVGSFRLSPDEGAAFIASIERQQQLAATQPVDSAEATHPDPVDSAEAILPEPVDAAASTDPVLLEVSLVDALLQLVHGGATTPEPGLLAATQPEVVLHVSVGDLVAEHPTRRHLAGGPAVGPATARRLACDPILTALLHDPEGAVIDVGRRHRLVTTRLRRAVYERDHYCCAFPGCRNTRWLDVHHITHWEDGGPTDLNNLLLLCGTHHRAHHHGTYAIEMINGEPTFETADHTPINQAPALRALPSPPGDLLSTNNQTLGPIQGHWGGQPTDTDWILTGFALGRERQRGA